MSGADERFEKLAAQVQHAEQRAEYAATVALAAIENTKHFLQTIDSLHDALGEMKQGMRKTLAMAERLAHDVLRPPAREAQPPDGPPEAATA